MASSEESPATAALKAQFRAHLSDKLIPELAANGSLGEDVSIVKLSVESVGGHGEDHWMSHAFRVAVEVRDKSGPRTLHLMAKYPIDDPVWCDSAVGCRNEEHMYNQVVPFFDKLWAEGAASDKEPLGLFPKCYLARAGDGTSGGHNVVVMEDLAPQGFRLAPAQTALDGAHVILALQRLGRMHGLSYSAKVRRKADLLALGRGLGETLYVESRRLPQAGYLSVLLPRGLSRLAARGDKDAATVEHLRRRLAASREASPAFDIMVDARSAEEPVAVIVHGDFCRNNMLFKYDPATGRPVDVRLIDLQNARYCSPAVDLSFFLFLNTTPSQRVAHWDDYFVAYYDGLSSAMRSILSTGKDPTMSPTMDMPSLASIRADFAKHAMYGYVICSWFLPVMQANDSPTSEDTACLQGMADKFEMGRQTGLMLEHIGGEAADDTIADLLVEFVDRGLVGL